MSYPHHPIEIHLHDKDGFVGFVESYKEEEDAVKAMPTMIAECLAEGDEYIGQHLLIVRHEVDGYTEWHEPIQKFEIFS
jgi:hypothetical protein